MLSCAVLQVDFSSLTTTWDTSLPWARAARGATTALPALGTLFLMEGGGTEMQRGGAEGAGEAAGLGAGCWWIKDPGTAEPKSVTMLAQATHQLWLASGCISPFPCTSRFPLRNTV